MRMRKRVHSSGKKDERGTMKGRRRRSSCGVGCNYHHDGLAGWWVAGCLQTKWVNGQRERFEEQHKNRRRKSHQKSSGFKLIERNKSWNWINQREGEQTRKLFRHFLAKSSISSTNWIWCSCSCIGTCFALFCLWIWRRRKSILCLKNVPNETSQDVNLIEINRFSRFLGRSSWRRKGGRGRKEEE